MSRSARSPAFSVICSAAASVSTWRQTCCSRFRLSCSCLDADLLVLVLLLLERRDRALEPLGGGRVGRGVLAQHVGVTPQAAPARDDLFERLLGADQLLELGGERLEPADRRLRQQAPPLADPRTRGTHPGTGG